MADASRSSNPIDSNPPGWGDVFAALPLEAPPASAWPAIAAQLDQKKARVRNRTWLTLAASLFALTVLPATWMLRDADRGTAPIAASPADAASPGAIARTPTTDTPTITAGHNDPRIATTGDEQSAQAISIATNTTHQVHTIKAHRSPDRTHPRTAAAPSIASVAQLREGADSTLETLYSESAQLETLLAFARDTRVESAPAASLAGAFDAELATIDARLAQPGLGASEQRMLWQARVETLQRSAGFESHLRLLAADGERLDGALVSID
jgi:hypothetical protein